MLADYVAAGFRDDRRTAGSSWPARRSGRPPTSRTHDYDTWAAFRDTRCPIRILRAADGSTFRIEGRRGLSRRPAASRSRPSPARPTSCRWSGRSSAARGLCASAL